MAEFKKDSWDYKNPKKQFQAGLQEEGQMLAENPKAAGYSDATKEAAADLARQGVSAQVQSGISELGRQGLAGFSGFTGQIADAARGLMDAPEQAAAAVTSALTSAERALIEQRRAAHNAMVARGAQMKQEANQFWADKIQEHLTRGAGAAEESGKKALGEVLPFILAGSDARLKEGVVQLEGALGKLLKLRGVTWNWRDPSRRAPGFGFIAQEVEEVFPELVANTDDGYKGIFYANMNAALVESVKELAAQNAMLLQRIVALEEVSSKSLEQGVLDA